MNQTYSVAFAGFRHGHIVSLLIQMQASPDFNVVACCEEDAATRRSLAADGTATITHDSFDAMLKAVPCDIVAIGDYFARRGALAIRALQAGRHVIADKPLCTDLTELAEIERLARAGNLRVGCMLDLRSSKAIATVRRLIREGQLGKITQIMFTGQHPLNRNSRPAWYFEPGTHGGTINDIASHALDIIPWMTGLAFGRVTAARAWQAFDVRSETFKDAAQMMFQMENGCGVMGDVAYAAPSAMGYQHPCYWRFTVWGTNGMVEFQYADETIRVYFDQAKEPVDIPVDPSAPQSYLEAFLADLQGRPVELDTPCVIEGARNVLRLQQAADRS